ncbi:hypothetical protein HDU97_004337 [Phlyctochytrium planicorne]|nr:hypothetical protein HDU97_004337 [Phlyctochytrium planicorne]
MAEDDYDWETLSDVSENDPLSTVMSDDGDDVVEEKVLPEFDNVQKFFFPSQTRSFQSRYTVSDAKTLIEKQYLFYLSTVLGKPQWWEKVGNKEILEKWKAEFPKDSPVDPEFLVMELLYIKAKRWEKETVPGGVEVNWYPLPPPGTYCSDDIGNNGLHERLVEGLAKAEEEARKKKRWHPGKENQVLDTFHPSNYPVVYGRTCYSTQPNTILGDRLLYLPSETKRLMGSIRDDVSLKFQWMPSVFEVSETGHVKILSYINNLNPRRHGDLYKTIATVFQRMLPMFERAMGAMGLPTIKRIEYDCSMSESKDDYVSKRWSEHVAKTKKDRMAIVKGFQREMDGEDNDEEEAEEGEEGEEEEDAEEGDGEDEDDDESVNSMDEAEEEEIFNEYYYELLDEEDLLEINVPKLPNFVTFLKDQEENINKLQKARYNLKSKQLRVIAKAASILLTPENPTYSGGNWHLEGTDNEAIVATGIYYYSIDNVTESRVQFRENFDGYGISYHQNEWRPVEVVYGINNGDPMLQPSGHAVSREGRTLVFPNGNQHMVPEFKLEDPSKPGHRKMLVFFLVHPDAKVPSSMEIPPQQAEWAFESLMQVLGKKLPELCVREIVGHCGSVWGNRRDAFYAQRLMNERSRISEGAAADVEELNLCEH